MLLFWNSSVRYDIMNTEIKSRSNLEVQTFNLQVNLISCFDDTGKDITWKHFLEREVNETIIRWSHSKIIKYPWRFQTNWSMGTQALINSTKTKLSPTTNNKTTMALFYFIFYFFTTTAETTLDSKIGGPDFSHQWAGCGPQAVSCPSPLYLSHVVKAHPEGNTPSLPPLRGWGAPWRHLSASEGVRGGQRLNSLEGWALD